MRPLDCRGVRELGALRFVDPVVDPGRILSGPRGYVRFLRHLRRYKRLATRDEIARLELYPQLRDWLPSSPYDGHYFFQDVWAARQVAQLAPPEHVDVGSRVDLVGFLTAITNVVFIDIRPLEAQLENLRSVAGSILNLPLADQSVGSLSCLHVAEHIGLGRYGDPLDPQGTLKAAAELQRVLAPGGQLLFSGPIGRPRTCFNAHRIHAPNDVIAMFPELDLTTFAAVDDAGRFHSMADPGALTDQSYACGLFRFTRPLST